MMRSPWEIDNELGLWYYHTDLPGTGGTLRELPEDFEVSEIATHTFSNGPYLICSLTKCNWDQHRAIKAIASGLGMSHQRIGFAGTKDKRAITTQYVSLYHVTEDDIARISIPDISLKPLGYTQHPIVLGNLEGNAFNICIKNISNNHILSCIN